MPRTKWLVALVLVWAGMVSAEGPDALKLVKDAATFAKNLPALSFDFEINTHMELGAEKRDIRLNAEVLLSGMQQSRFKVKTPSDEAVVTADGESQYVYRPQDKKFVKVDAPLDREDAVSMISGNPMRYSTVWLGQFLNDSLDLLQDARGEFLGEENGLQHIKLSYPKFTAELWLASTPAVLPQKLVMDVSAALVGTPANGANVVNTLTFSNWQIAPAATPELFAWKAPEGVTEQSSRSAPGGDLLGKAAPDFSLGMLGGGDMKLSSHKDKEVVILDFFATWCGPCRMAMPIVGQVAQAYKDKGVVLYAVNCGEEADKVKRFLEGQKLDLPVAMDTDSKVQMTYGATSIPRMVVIGKDGTVQAVHAGYSPDLGKSLSSQLDTLLAGKSLLD